ncbi:MAG: transposase [Spirochaetes bacterium]|nr:transposase [Spirochaetota bacterium]
MVYIWIGRQESAKFWMGILTEPQRRGVKDVMIAAADGLTGFPEAIRAVYPQTEVLFCVVHLFRNSLKFAFYMDRKKVSIFTKLTPTSPQY